MGYFDLNNVFFRYIFDIMGIESNDLLMNLLLIKNLNVMK